jgi:hypothetical protein
LLTIYGADGGNASPDRLGEEIVPADVNGDGLTDMLIGAYRADGPNNSQLDGGEVYILYGAASWGASTAVVDMASPPPNVTIIYGARAQAIAGDSIAAGDINGDGCDDLFIGVPGDRGPLGRTSSGGIVVLGGGPRLPRIIDLAAPPIPAVWVQGADAADFAAYWSGSGDLDGDGLVDAVPNGMHGQGPRNDRLDAGEVYAISGAALRWCLNERSPLTHGAGPQCRTQRAPAERSLTFREGLLLRSSVSVKSKR